MSNLMDITPSQLKKAADLKEQISKLEKELQSLLGGAAPATASTKSTNTRKMSPAARAKIVAAQKARWARIKAEKKAPEVKPQAKKQLSAEARAKIVAAQKARWAKIKGKGKAKS